MVFGQILEASESETDGCSGNRNPENRPPENVKFKFRTAAEQNTERLDKIMEVLKQRKCVLQETTRVR